MLLLNSFTLVLTVICLDFQMDCTEVYTSFAKSGLGVLLCPTVMADTAEIGEGDHHIRYNMEYKNLCKYINCGNRKDT